MVVVRAGAVHHLKCYFAGHQVSYFYFQSLSISPKQQNCYRTCHIKVALTLILLNHKDLIPKKKIPVPLLVIIPPCRHGNITQKSLNCRIPVSPITVQGKFLHSY